MNNTKKRMTSLTVGVIWATIAISVAEIWAGHQIGSAGLFWGMVIIIVGHVIGGLMLAGTGIIGTRHRVMSMASTRLVLGNRGSIIPSILNVLQLVGWATIMLALSGQIGADAGASLGGPFASKTFWIILIGAGTLAWSLLVNEERMEWAHTVVAAALLLLTLLVSWVVLTKYDIDSTKTTEISLSGGMRLMDLVIVMPISFAPLIADYSRMAHSERGAFWGNFLGYGIMSSWMYAIGLIVFLATGSTDPAGNLIGVMGKIHLAIPAMLLVFASTVTSDFPDIYSSACSILNINRKIKPIYTVWATGILTTILALFFDLSRYESFLILIGALFIPLIALLLTDYFVVRRGKLDENIDFETGAGMAFTGGFRISSLFVWALGTTAYFVAQKLDLPLGASITSLLATALLHLLCVKLIPAKKQS